jgi:hypothetical protein
VYPFPPSIYILEYKPRWLNMRSGEREDRSKFSQDLCKIAYRQAFLNNEGTIRDHPIPNGTLIYLALMRQDYSLTLVTFSRVCCVSGPPIKGKA